MAPGLVLETLRSAILVGGTPPSASGTHVGRSDNFANHFPEAWDPRTGASRTRLSLVRLGTVETHDGEPSVLLREHPPIYEKSGHRKMGSTAYVAFWSGYDGMPCGYESTSMTAAAWRAGRDHRKKSDVFCIERVSDGTVYKENGDLADFNIQGTPVRMSRAVAEIWFRNARFRIRLVPAES